jgi:hypothetical protein
MKLEDLPRYTIIQRTNDTWGVYWVDDFGLQNLNTYWDHISEDFDEYKEFGSFRIISLPVTHRIEGDQIVAV